MRTAIVLSILLIVAFFGMRMMSSQVAPFACVTDEDKYLTLVQMFDKNPGAYWQLKETENIQRPNPAMFHHHRLYVIGPKVGLIVGGLIYYRLVKWMSNGSYPIAQTFFDFNILCLLLQGCLLWFLIPQRATVARTWRDELVRIGIIAFFLTLLPLQAQHYWQRTYNPLFGVCLLGSLLCVRHSFVSGKFQQGYLMLAGMVLGSSLTVSASAPLALVAVGALVLSLYWKRWWALAYFSGGIFVFFGFVECLYQWNDRSFAYLLYRHVFENIYQNQIGVPFPYVPLVPLHYAFRFAPALLVGLVVGIIGFRWVRDPWSRALFIALGVWMATFELSPTIPLGRTTYAFFLLACAWIATQLSAQRVWQSLQLTLFVALIAVNVAGYFRKPQELCWYERDENLLQVLQQKGGVVGQTHHSTKSLP